MIIVQLLIIDVNSIQNYIFETNSLKEIIGASSLISRVQKNYLYNVLKELKGNIAYDKESEKWSYNKNLISDAIDYELILSDGGLTIIIFNEKAKADEVQAKILAQYKKFDIQVTSIITEFSNNESGDKYFKFIKELKQIRSNGNCDGALLSAYPLKYCPSCAKRYVEYKYQKGEEDIELLCRICSIKRNNAGYEGEIEARLRKKDGTVSFPQLIENISNDRNNNIALVSFDGNKVGNYIKTNIFNENYLIDCLRKYREFSIDFNSAINQTIIDSIGEVFISLKQKLKFRPLIVAGDDITILIDSARVIEFIRIFNSKWSEQQFSKDIKFSIGLVLAKAKFPLHQLFEISHDLLRNAKKKQISTPTQIDSSISAIDFHMVNSSLLAQLSILREKEYCYDDDGSKYNCTSRPYFYNVFDEILKKAQKIKHIPNSKFKSLREILRLGRTESKRALHHFKLHLNPTQKEKFLNIVNNKFDLWDNDPNGSFKTKLMDIIELSELVA